MEQKVTLITTVKNEEKSIRAFLTSIEKQTKLPDEVIIVDGESTDATASLISNFNFRTHEKRARRPFQISEKKIKFIVRKGNRSIGRNTAIKASMNNVILVSDAGCTLDKYWVERISKPFLGSSVDVVAGFYKPVAKSIFEKCLSTYTCTMFDKLDKKNFLPSSRSVAFRKGAWKKAGGYPEELDTCEDLVFASRLRKLGFNFYVEDKAIVYWPQRKNIFEAAKQFFLYAVGDGKARYFRASTPFLFGRYIFGIMFLTYVFITKTYYLLPIIYCLFFLYLCWAIWKNYKYVKNNQALIFLPLLQITSDITVIAGTLYGIAKAT